MIQFFAPEIASNPILPEADSQHCVRVLRMKEGDIVNVVDGKGSLYTCRIVDAHPKRCMLEVLSLEMCPLPWQQCITVAIAPTKHMDRMEWLTEKLVEIGVNRIVPLRCRYSERKEIKEERLQKIAVSAMKQSLKAALPEVTAMTDISDFMAADKSPQRLIAYCSQEIERRLLSHVYVPRTDTTILIGPEGDFSGNEIQAALDTGYIPVSLGDNRLRTETAALYAVSAFHILDEVRQQ